MLSESRKEDMFHNVKELDFYHISLNRDVSMTWYSQY